MRISRLALVLVALTIAIPVAIGATRTTDRPVPRASVARQTNELATNLTLHTVATGNVETVVSGLGSLEPVERVSLGFEINGRVEAVYVADGDTVYPGDVLAELNNDALEIEHEQALLSIDNAEIDLLNLVEPVSDDDSALAQAAIDSARAAYTAAITAVSPAEIEAAELQYQQEIAEYEALLDSRVMRSGGAGGGDERIALAEAEIGAATFDMEIARLNIENTRRSGPNPSVYVAEIREAELNYEALFVGPSEYDLQAAEIRVERAYADLYDVELDDSQTRLVATITGEVSNLDIAVGDPVTVGEPVVEIVNRSPLQLVVQVDENDISTVNVGMRATVQLDALPETPFTAQVSDIAMLSTVEDGVVSYDVTLDLLGNNPRIREGMTAEAFIQLDAREDVVVIPNAFLTPLSETTALVSVYDPTTGTGVPREIIIGLQGQANTEVLSGFTVGERLVVEGDES